ncbi:MAG: DNA repair protein RecO [Candidatus Ancillula sp.]|jgi:DNA repair protein RecO (recombination protein O)|nr:DNA repair protein RecO [Candidatus Ancillula sp.]
MPAPLKDEGIVIKHNKLGEADYIATILTRNHGKISCVVKGARKTLSKNSAALSLFVHSSLKFTPGRNLAVVNESEIIDSYAVSIMKDYDKYLSASQMCNLIEKLVFMNYEPVTVQYQLLNRALKMLAQKLPQGISPNAVAISYTLRALTLAGYEIDPDEISSPDIIIPHPNNESQVNSALDFLLQGDWKGLQMLFAKYPRLESAVTKGVASFAVRQCGSKLNAYDII